MATTTKKAALLQTKVDEYIATMEAPGSGCNYNRLDTDRLLILEALNDWSGRTLSEGGDIKFSYACDDPACATHHEVSELIERLHSPPGVVLYPVSGFSLSDTDGLLFHRDASTYRMLPHTSGSRTDGIGIAEATHIRDTEAALQLWAFCATEDCMAYLLSQMNEHNLYFEDNELAASRQIISSALLSHFSVGQIRNAIWRTVRHAAALSTRQYYNTGKASKTIPKKLDSVLTQHAANPASFEHYDRPVSRPIGAVLSLMLNRFGIADNTPGPEVRARLAADAELSSPMPPDEPEFDDGRGLVLGTAYFDKEPTLLDYMILSSFIDIHFDPSEIQWDCDHVLGRLEFSMNHPYSFDGNAFLQKFLEANDIPAPTEADYARHAKIAIELSKDPAQRTDKSGKEGVIHEVLAKAGVNPEHIPHICFTLRFSSDPQQVVRTLSLLPGDMGLTAFRVSHAHVYSDFFEKSDSLCSNIFSFDFPESLMEPAGSDADMIKAISEGDIDHFVDIVTNALMRSVRIYHPELNNLLLSGIGQRLIDRARKNSEGSTPPAI